MLSAIEERSGLPAGCRMTEASFGESIRGLGGLSEGQIK
jgi:hypothetical protein